MLRLVSLLFLALLCLSISPSHADGVPIVNGRYNGPASLLTLSPEQLRDVETTRRFVLNAPQRAELATVAVELPSYLEAMTAQQAQVGCTCHTANIAVWLSRTVVQVPHVFLKGDSHPLTKLLEEQATKNDPTSLTVVVDTKGQLRANRQVMTVAQIGTLIRDDQPDVWLLMPPKAADIALSKKWRKELLLEMSRYTEQYKTGFVWFD